MKKLIAAALSSTALLAAPAVFAQTSGAAGNAPGTSAGSGSINDNRGAPLTPSQVETSEGAVYNPPPIDQSGAAQHLSAKGMTGNDTAVGNDGSATGDDGGQTGAGTGGADGSGVGDAGAADGAGAGDGSGAGAGAGSAN